MTYRGLAYRAHDPRWAWSPLSGEGSVKFGGRFNRIGTPALYLSLDLSTAICEASQGFAGRFPPLTIVNYDVDSSPVIDLTLPNALADLGVDDAQIRSAWKRLAQEDQPVPTWDLADRLAADGFAGAIVRSLAPGAMPSSRNLVLWTWSDSLPSRVTTFDPDGRLRPPLTK